MKKFVCIFVILLLPITVSAKQGCCSWHGGVSGACSASGRQICNDGTLSPSCTCTSTYVAPTYIYGCTDSKAKNYNSLANKSDGSCIYPIYGCTDPSAKNYNINSNTDDKSCQYVKEIEETKEIMYITKYTSDNTEDFVDGQIITAGQNGSKEVVYTVVVDSSGNQISKKIKNEKVLKAAVPEIIFKNDIKVAKTEKVLKDGGNEDLNEKDTRETSGTDLVLTYLIFYFFNYIYVRKSKDNKLIISNILKQKILLMVFLTILYIILFFPMFIDSVIIVIKLIRKLYNWKV